MPERDLSLLVDAAQAAGEIALAYWSGSNRVWDKGNDDPVSEADLAVDAALRDRLLLARPHYGWLSEETEDSPDRLDRAHVFVVDPIDGTRAFVAGERTWAVSLAVVEMGKPVVGVVHLPARARTYTAVLGGGASLNGTAMTAAPSPVGPARLLASRPALDPQYWPGGLPDISRHFRPSLAYRLALVGEGRFDAMATFRPSWEWDLAAGALIAAEAGARVTDGTGGSLGFNNPHPQVAGIMAATPEFHATLVARRTGRN
ncbi:MAG: 3'(2'),5'-bisphosphate nucleotidase CysQ [Pseudomonadota bacterium]